MIIVASTKELVCDDTSNKEIKLMYRESCAKKRWSSAMTPNARTHERKIFMTIYIRDCRGFFKAFAFSSKYFLCLSKNYMEIHCTMFRLIDNSKGVQI